MIMKNLIKLPFREITLAYCNPPTNSFGIEKNGRIPKWDHCREQFAVHFDETVSGFYFCHKADCAEAIASFILKFENILHQKNKSKVKYETQFAYTSQTNVLYIELANFWKDCFYKRSLFTLLVRCGQNYTDDNFDDALFSPNLKESAYLLETKNAVIRFMFGFTKYTGISPPVGTGTVIKHGWREEFCKLTVEEIRNRLVLPDNIAKTINIVGIDSLWS